MVKKGPPDSLEAFEKEAKGLRGKKYVLKLYVAGTSSKSNEAILNVRKICEEHLPGRYELEVIDVYQQPESAKSEQILAAPTLIKKLPPPLRRLIGTMADTDKVLVGLNIEPKNAGTAGRTGPKGKKDEIDNDRRE